MIPHGTSIRSLLIAAVLLLAGCVQGVGSYAEFQPLLDQVKSAPDTVPHRGTRRFVARTVGAFGPIQVEYTEEVASDGLGCISILPMDVLSTITSAALFESMQELRQRFIHRYRDFRIRDMDLLLANYSVLVDQTVSTEVAGRTAYQLTLSANAQSDGRTYEVAVDAETFLVLAYRELSSEGVELTSMEYMTYESDPGEINCFESEVSEVSLGSVVPPVADLGFVPLIPKVVPPGYTLLDVAEVSNAQLKKNWLKMTYTDGVETLFFLQERPALKARGLVRGEIQVNGSQAGSSMIATGQGPGTSNVVPDKVTVFDVGGLMAVDGVLGGKGVISMGKVSRDALLVFLDSTL